MKYLLLILSILLLVAPAYAQSGDCGLASRLVVGAAGRVTPGEANNVRDSASRSGVLIGQIEGGQVFGVIGGAQCDAGRMWVQVEFTDGGEVLTGWTVESSDTYFVDPLDGTFAGAANGSMSVSLVLPPDVASAAEVRLEAGVPYDEDNPGTYSPAYIRIAFFADYPDDSWMDYDELNDPAVLVYPSDAFAHWTLYSDEGQIAIEGVDKILSEPADLTTFSVINNDLPDFSPNVDNLLLAFLDELEFGTGSGVRYLGCYSSILSDVDNICLAYRYAGMTTDGAYFVNGYLPAAAPMLPGESGVAFSIDYSDTDYARYAQYAADNAAFFEAIPLEAYTPNLAQLDALVASLWIEGTDGE